jgi:two-component system cell cycle response regulator
VLVVDDDEAIRLRVRDLLEGSGLCEVHEAANGIDGLALARSEAPDLILLDLMMPGMSGIEVCETLRGDPATCEIPIIVLSAADEEEAMPAALAAGAEDYLRKPIPSSELAAKVRTILELNRYRALTRERRRLRWLVEHSNEALVMLDRGGRLVEANQRARELFALPSSPGCDALAIISAHYECEPPEAFDRLRAQGFKGGESFAVVRPETSLLSAHWLQVDPFTGGRDDHGELLLKFTDRSGRVHHDLQTWSFHRLLSHKIRTPLNGVGSMLELLAGCPGVENDREAAELLRIAAESNRRLEDTLTSILDYHKALSGAAEPPADTEPVSWLSLLRSSSLEAGLDPALLRVSGPEDLVVPVALAGPMRQSVVEVVENYLKFGSAGSLGLDASFTPPATLRLFAPGRVLPPEALANLGRPYWQIERLFSGEIPGMGLGLATARLLLRSHGAGLRFDNSPDSSGIISELTLPHPLA